MIEFHRRRKMGLALPMALLVGLLGLGSFSWLVVRAQALPTGVVPVAWDKEACAHCRMHVGEKGFAAQLQLTDGQVLNFDDPGCLFRWLDGNPAPIHAIYNHHYTDDRWLARGEVGFIEASPTPMGFGLAAVEASAPGSMSWNDAAARARKGGTR